MAQDNDGRLAGHLIIASDHNQGVYLPINLSENYTMPTLIKAMRKCASLAV